MNHLGDTNKMVGEDHIRDATKMVNDTPRTDEAYFRKSATMYDMAGEMKRMERELNAANSRIELLMSANAEVARIAGERDAAEKRVKRLEAVVNDPHALWINWLRGDVKLPAGIGDVRQYQDRIKQLEEFVEQLTNPKFTRDDLPKEALLQRIKRLEEAGGRMADVLTWSAAIQYKRSPTVAAWRKAKESKP